MIAMLIICMVVPMMNCQNCTIKEDDILEISKMLDETVIMRDFNEAICIGSARSGKSALINYLIGNKLMVKKQRYNTILVKADENSLGPEIGSTSVSKTLHPTKWTSRKLSNLTIWDTPGFEDNRGEIQDIINAFCIYSLVKNIKSVKFIAVISFDVINDDYTKPFTTFLNNLEELFGEMFENVFDSITIIFSKVPFRLFDQQVDNEFINNRLRRYSSSTEIQIDTVSRKFLKYIVNNRNHVGIFRKVNDNNDILHIDDNIFQSIENSYFTSTNSLNDLHPVISKTSKICLHKIRDNFLKPDILTKLEIVVLSVCSEKIKNLNDSSMFVDEKTVMGIRNKLIAIEQVLLDAVSNTTIYEKKIQLIETIDVRIKVVIEENNLLNYYKLNRFTDYCLNENLGKTIKHNLEKLLHNLIFQIKQSIEVTFNSTNDNIHEKHKKKMENMNKQFQPVILFLRSALNNAKGKSELSSEEGC
ncbi:uncharacterized protein LOC122501426 [Leptopilina heterotoma]|uniref:uncharacterized protein LOC122501426 n=1 Tax=Leptopilina heterotoma TaxID=63436 RepID=UPI001CA8A750|nr:uncharacterized protein LOC122501426 [Leptopilina heterotoma]